MHAIPSPKTWFIVVPAAPSSGEQCDFILAGVLFRHRLPYLVGDVLVFLKETVKGHFEDGPYSQIPVDS
jgi:hypothetical protein